MLQAVLKVQGERTDWRRGSRTGISPGASRIASPSVERRAFPQSGAGPASTVQCRTADQPEMAVTQPPVQQMPVAQRARRMSRVTKQHSYDEEVKPASSHHQVQEPAALGQSPHLIFDGLYSPEARF